MKMLYDPLLVRVSGNVSKKWTNRDDLNDRIGNFKWQIENKSLATH